MSWNYRIVRYKNGGGYGLHEVYYDYEYGGKIFGVTEAAVAFVCNAEEGPEGVKASLLMALADAGKYPVLEEESYSDAEEEKTSEGEGETV